MGLLFERFLSTERAEPPDIDLDFEHERREEVIQEVYAKYGRDRAAMVAKVIRYRGALALREVGKVFGVPETSLDRVAKLLSHCTATLEPDGARARPASTPRAAAAPSPRRARRRDPGLPAPPVDPPGRLPARAEPLHDIVPDRERARWPDRTVIQWDKDDVETLGFFKVDLLGLGVLTTLHKCFDLLQRARAASISSLATIPPRTRRVRHDLQRADTVGVFQIESRAQMAMLPRLKPRTFYDLVIEVAIVRPGPDLGRHGASRTCAGAPARSRSSIRTRASSRSSRRRSACRSSRSR